MDCCRFMICGSAAVIDTSFSEMNNTAANNIREASKKQSLSLPASGRFGSFSSEKSQYAKAVTILNQAKVELSNIRSRLESIARNPSGGHDEIEVYQAIDEASEITDRAGSEVSRIISATKRQYENAVTALLTQSDKDSMSPKMTASQHYQLKARCAVWKFSSNWRQLHDLSELKFAYDGVVKCARVSQLAAREGFRF